MHFVFQWYLATSQSELCKLVRFLLSALYTQHCSHIIITSYRRDAIRCVARLLHCSTVTQQVLRGTLSVVDLERFQGFHSKPLLKIASTTDKILIEFVACASN